jgi:spore photoproduct lyase
MSTNSHYADKFATIAGNTLFPHLPVEEQEFLHQQAERFRFTQQELRIVAEIAMDLAMWQEGGIRERWPQGADERPTKQDKQRLIKELESTWRALKASPNRYDIQENAQPSVAVDAVAVQKERLGLGQCPVASPKTRCCNLLTLDAVENCGFECSYCSIQPFFGNRQVYFDTRFGEKLADLQIEPEQIYHIGTGQSSDSLMWGNSHGTLEALLEFARSHPNVILELKSKSDNIGYLLEQPLPANLICSWSLSPQTIIDHEEHGSSSLERRLWAARQIADHGGLVGFHFHPIIHYHGWREEYAAIAESIQQQFLPRELVMVSLGTLTYTKPVIRQIREKGAMSKILKMDLVEADGKLSYPDEIKRELFSHLYDSFSPQWKNELFFYLCMENQRHWEPVFGYQYESNEQFEAAMKTAYMEKIRAAAE